MPPQSSGLVVLMPPAVIVVEPLNFARSGWRAGRVCVSVPMLHSVAEVARIVDLASN